MAKKTRVLRDFKPNSGIRAWYRKQLEQIVKDINVDLNESILADYKDRQIAMDGISDWLGRAMDLFVARWSDKLLGLGEEIASLFVKKSASNFDREFKRALKGHGFTVDLHLTDYTKKVAQDAIAMNVALIRSIGNQYLEKVQMHVWESVLSGMDASELAKNLRHDFGVSKRRANIIARDQTSKVNSAIEQARRLEIGIEEAIWLHSGGSKEPRKSHVAANGKRYKIKEGLLIDGEHIQTGEKINCHCTSRSVLPWEMQGYIELKDIKAA